MPEKVEPTKEQTQWLWEQCGFKYIGHTAFGDIWEVPDGGTYCDNTPPIDLNNLFQYPLSRYKNAYISFEREGNTVYCYGKYDEGEYPCGCPTELRLAASVEIGDMDYDKACALALFWAIYKALGGK